MITPDWIDTPQVINNYYGTLTRVYRLKFHVTYNISITLFNVQWISRASELTCRDSLEPFTRICPLRLVNL
jgi:hypothetical protein